MDNLVLEKNYFDEIYNNLISSRSPKISKTKFFLLTNEFEALGMKLKNQFCLTNYADKLFDSSSGKPNLDFFKFYENISKSNAALICTAGLDVELNINNFTKKNAFVVSDWLSKLRASGSKLFLTLKTNKGRMNKKDGESFALSASLSKEYNNINNYALPAFDSQLKRIAKCFLEGAEFAKNSNFDGLVIDGSLSNLLGEMTSKEFNRRKLGYFMARDEFVGYILENISKNVKKMPILYKISPFSFLNDCFGDENILSLSGANIKGTDKAIFELLKNLVKLGVDGFLFEFGVKENEFLSEFAPNLGENIFAEFYDNLEKYFAENKLKNKFGEDVILILSDNFGDFKQKTENSKRMFEITKEIYSDIDFIKKAASGCDINHCIRCGICKKYAEQQNKVVCTINPELSYSLNVNFKQKINNVAVVGAGTSGIVAATTLARRGYSVVLFEKGDKLNKNGKSCEVFSFDKRLQHFNNYIEKSAKTLEEQNKLTIKLGTEFKANDAKNFEAVVLATGFRELFLGVPGAVLRSVVSLFDILSKKISFEGNKHIVIYAKSELSFKLALYLCENKYDVAVVIPSSEFLINLPQSSMSYYLTSAKKLKLKVFVCAEVKNINEDSVELYCNYKTRNLSFVSIINNMRSGKTYKFQPEAKTIDCNLFIYDPDLAENNRLFYDIVKSGYMGELYMVGDALKVSDLLHEVQTGYFVGNNV